MKFLDPKNDIMFKKIFGNQQKPSIVMSFLNAILQLPEGEKIEEVFFRDPQNVPDNLEQKKSTIDVQCRDQKHREFIIEMQSDYQSFFGERSLYYSAKAVGRALKKKGLYQSLMPVIFVGVLDFTLFDKNEEPDCISEHRILNIKTLKNRIDKLKFVFIELPKFKKTIDQLETVSEKWIYFLQNAEDCTQVPQELKTTKEIEEAFKLLNEGSMTTDELQEYEVILDARRCEESEKYDAFVEGEARGKAEGKAEGEAKAKLELAKRLLAKKMSIDEVAEVTCLSVEEIKKL